MIQILANRTYRHFFGAQIIALVGTGLMTVALGLLAYDLVGDQAGAVLGTALAIKMIAYVTIAPLVGGFAGRLPRRAFLVTLDLIRAAIALALPFVDQVWQIYVLIFLLQSTSAAFTPTFQATILDILADESDYTRALSLSRLAYDLENLLSPTLAAVLLTIISFHSLFAGTVVGFIASSLLVLSARLPEPTQVAPRRGVYENTTRGIRIYLATPRLRGLLALSLSVAAAGAMVIVNTVVLVRGVLGRPDSDVAIALACFGGGSIVAALALPPLLDRRSDRTVMLSAAGLLSGTLILLVVALVGGASISIPPASTSVPYGFWPILLATWALLGIAYSAVQTPSGLLLRRSTQAGDRPALFAAQFALSHACWLLTYPLAGWLGLRVGMPITLLALGGLTLLGLILAAAAWPAADSEIIEHSHPDLPPSHPHLLESEHGTPHAHAFFIDDLHRRWPSRVG